MRKLFLTALSVALSMNFIIAQEIFDFVRNGDLSKVKELVDKDSNQLTARNKRQSTPLIVAVSLGKLDMVKFLLDQGAAVNDKGPLGRASIHFAAEADNLEMVKLLVEKGADYNIQDNFMFTPFMISGINVAKYLVDKGVDINLEISQGSVLDIAMSEGKTEVVEFLMDKGIKLPDVGTIRYGNILANALRSNCQKYIDLCFKNGLSINYESQSKSTMLHYAAEGGEIDLVNKLISLGVPICSNNIYGWTPLHSAAATGSKAVVEILISKGLDKNIRTLDGKSPYNLAVENKKTEVADYLSSIGADKESRTVPKVQGDYFGCKKPGKKAEPFAPWFISSNSSFHTPVNFTSDGKEAFWTVMNPWLMLTSKLVNGVWTLPDTAALMSKGDVPFISPDGSKLFYLQTVELDGTNKEQFYVRDRSGNGWTNPYLFSNVINSVPGIHWCLSMDAKGNLYFGARQGGTTITRVYCSEFNNGVYQTPQIVQVIKDMRAFSPYISPDGQYLIVSNNQAGKVSLEILFRRKDGSWTPPTNLSAIIGIDGFCAVVSGDGKYLFFVSQIEGRNIPYWVDASVIDDARKEALCNSNLLKNNQ